MRPGVGAVEGGIGIPTTTPSRRRSSLGVRSAPKGARRRVRVREELVERGSCCRGLCGSTMGIARPKRSGAASPWSACSPIWSRGRRGRSRSRRWSASRIERVETSSADSEAPAPLARARAVEPRLLQRRCRRARCGSQCPAVQDADAVGPASAQVGRAGCRTRRRSAASGVAVRGAHLVRSSIARSAVRQRDRAVEGAEPARASGRCRRDEGR